MDSLSVMKSGPPEEKLSANTEPAAALQSLKAVMEHMQLKITADYRD